MHTPQSYRAQFATDFVLMPGGGCADVKNRRGNTSRGRKITGMQFMPKDPSQLLITSNDSRVRLYDGDAPLQVPDSRPRSQLSK